MIVFLPSRIAKMEERSSFFPLESPIWKNDRLSSLSNCQNGRTIVILPSRIAQYFYNLQLMVLSGQIVQACEQHQCKALVLLINRYMYIFFINLEFLKGDQSRCRFIQKSSNPFILFFMKKMTRKPFPNRLGDPKPSSKHKMYGSSIFCRPLEHIQTVF